MNSYIPIVLGMALVIYIPRVVPLLLLKKLKLRPEMMKFLQFIPYTSLSILIARGILTSDPVLLPAAAAGIALSGLMAYWRGNLVLSVLTGIAISFLVITYLG